jgi:hypothetical protein
MFRSSKTSSSKAKSKRERAKALPWATLLQAFVVVRKHWRSLSEKDRARLAALARDSRGRWGNLNAKERAELRKLAGKLDLKGAARDVAGLARGGRARRKCRRGAHA